MIIVIGGLDSDFRPKSYLCPLNSKAHCCATVRGKERRSKRKGHTRNTALPKARG
jgi:hypothetical protein